MSDLGQIGQADPASVSTPVTRPTSADIVNAGIASGGGWTGGLPSVAKALLPTTALGNVGLVAVGVVLAVGALLISQKENITNVTVKAADIAARAGVA